MDDPDGREEDDDEDDDDDNPDRPKRARKRISRAEIDLPSSPRTRRAPGALAPPPIGRRTLYEGAAPTGRTRPR
ncbi:MAG: hypothetical protein IPN33_18820 [Saprospiraceae bacterium]|nr:hypothetical protein [Saprospiraceae bacterium]